MMDWQNTARPFSRSPAPENCATCTENPVTAAVHHPPSSHVELETKPMEAEALAPRLPTMAASMYCIMVVLSCARTAGTLKLTTICNCRLREGS